MFIAVMQVRPGNESMASDTAGGIHRLPYVCGKALVNAAFWGFLSTAFNGKRERINKTGGMDQQRGFNLSKP